MRRDKGLHGDFGRKLRQDEQDGQDVRMEDQELTKGAGARIAQGKIPQSQQLFHFSKRLQLISIKKLISREAHQLI